jgi:hypothetical protein
VILTLHLFLGMAQQIRTAWGVKGEPTGAAGAKALTAHTMGAHTTNDRLRGASRTRIDL